MISNKLHSIFFIFSQITGYILHPLLVTIYVAIIVLFGDTYLNSPNISIQFKLILLSYIALLTIAIPLILFYLLYIFKFISGFKLQTRNDKVFPLLIIAICYLVSMFVCGRLIGQMLAQKIFFTIAIVASVANIIAFYYKMSFHTIGSAVVLAFIVAFNYVGYGDMETEIILTIILSGLLATCRLYLEKHTITEIAVSYAFGLFFTLILLYI